MVCLFLVNDLSGIKDSNFEPMWNNFKSDYSSSSDAASNKKRKHADLLEE